jgi:hypothetical protein
MNTKLIFFGFLSSIHLRSTLLTTTLRTIQGMSDRTIAKSPKVMKFISSLYRFLQDNTYRHILTWSEDGTSFEILDQKMFAEVVLPNISRHNNYSSFVRQLNKYSFKKIRNTPGIVKLVYKHPYFQRDLQDLLPQLRREKLKIKTESSSNSTFNPTSGLSSPSSQSSISSHFESVSLISPLDDSHNSLNQTSPSSLQTAYDALKHENSQLRSKVTQLIEKVYYLEEELERSHSQISKTPNSSTYPNSTLPSPNRTYVPPHYPNTGDPTIVYSGYSPHPPYPPFPPYPYPYPHPHPHDYGYPPSFPNQSASHGHHSHYEYSHPPPTVSSPNNSFKTTNPPT